MEKPKTKVIKSKSSNSAITKKCEVKRHKPEGHRKKSKSNAEFQTLAVKKRGVYVENKHAKTLNARDTEMRIDEIQPVKPPPRPRAGSKRFLASVLTILSKSTTGTQYPDAVDSNDKRTKTKKKLTKETTVPEAHPPAESEKKKKPRFRSKILNENKNQVDKFEVLQSKKEIVLTPSLYSERSYREDIKWSDLPRLVKPDEDANDASATMNNLVREVTEGRKIKEKKVKVVDPDPATLVSEHRDDKRLYNFFVDLLETTFSVYNVNAEYDAAPIPSAVSSKIALEMDESVARKLHVGTEMFDDITQKPSKHFYCIKNDDNSWNDEKLIDYFQTSPSSTKRMSELPLKCPSKRRRMKESFTLKSKTPPKSKSAVITQQKSFYRKEKKADLLNILKQQLKMDHVSFEEPQNLYQALKVMAKNKRKQKTIRFDGTAKPREGFKSPECMLKRRKVISSSTKSSSKYESEYMRSTGSVSRKFSEFSGHKRNVAEKTEELSNHSLEVYGFDYEVPYKRPGKREKEVFMAYHSSPSNSEHGREEELFKFTEGSSSTIREFTNDNYDSIELCC